MQVAADAGEAAERATLKQKLFVGPAAANDSGALSCNQESLGGEGVNGSACAFRDKICQQLANHSRSLKVEKLPPPLHLGLDVEELPAWGLDCYTHRQVCENEVGCGNFCPRQLYSL